MAKRQIDEILRDTYIYLRRRIEDFKKIKEQFRLDRDILCLEDVEKVIYYLECAKVAVEILASECGHDINECPRCHGLNVMEDDRPWGMAYRCLSCGYTWDVVNDDEPDYEDLFNYP